MSLGLYGRGLKRRPSSLCNPNQNSRTIAFHKINRRRRNVPGSMLRNKGFGRASYCIRVQCIFLTIDRWDEEIRLLSMIFDRACGMMECGAAACRSL